MAPTDEPYHPDGPGRRGGGEDEEALTLGVEEEFQLLDRRSGALVSRGRQVLAALPEGLGFLEVQGELPLSQVETATPVCRTLAEVRGHVGRLRAAAAHAARAAGCALVASGTAPIADWRVQEAARGERYEPLHTELRDGLVREQLIAGLHVHVGVGDRDRAVAVLDRTRPWLPVLAALVANSPYWLGADTGYASWRTVHWWRWPVSGPPPPLGSAAAYDEIVSRLLLTRALPDPAKVYWDARLSARYPTVEFRATDVPLSVGETVMVAGLVRALARTALRALDDGVAPPEVPPDLLRGAIFLAARDGLSDALVDPLGRSASPRPAAEVVTALLDHVGASLEECGDAAVVREAAQRVLAAGNGAARQRAAFGGGGLPAVVDLLVRETVAQ